MDNSSKIKINQKNQPTIKKRIFFYAIVTIFYLVLVWLLMIFITDIAYKKSLSLISLWFNNKAIFFIFIPTFVLTFNGVPLIYFLLQRRFRKAIETYIVTIAVLFGGLLAWISSLGSAGEWKGFAMLAELMYASIIFAASIPITIILYIFYKLGSKHAHFFIISAIIFSFYPLYILAETVYDSITGEFPLYMQSEYVIYTKALREKNIEKCAELGNWSHPREVCEWLVNAAIDKSFLCSEEAKKLDKDVYIIGFLDYRNCPKNCRIDNYNCENSNIDFSIKQNDRCFTAYADSDYNCMISRKAIENKNALLCNKMKNEGYFGLNFRLETGVCYVNVELTKNNLLRK